MRNAALAGALAILAGFDPERAAAGMGAVEPEPGRGRLHALGQGGWLLDESYNASPDSILACALALLQLEGGEPVAVLGCVRELGAQAGRLHREVGAALRAAGLSRLWAYGDQSRALAEGFGGTARAYPDFPQLRDDAAGLGALPLDGRILVKGSRFWAAEQVVGWVLDQDPPRS